jgi:ribosomal protein S18 acetylase RimI-like enzyme
MPHQKAATQEADLRDLRGAALDGVRVRAAKASDLPAAIALDAENTGLRKAAYWQERFEWYAGRQPDRFFLVAERDGAMLGFIVGEVRAWEFGSPPSGWIFAVHISPAVRQVGLGALLFEEICERFRAAGVQHVRTMLAKDAHLLLSFFRGLGMMGGPFIQLEKRLGP